MFNVCPAAACCLQPAWLFVKAMEAQLQQVSVPVVFVEFSVRTFIQREYCSFTIPINQKLQTSKRIRSLWGLLTEV